MPNIKEFDAPDAKLNPTSLGTDSRSGTARRVGSIFGGQASAEETLARETSRLASDTGKLASETSHLGAEKGAALTQLGHQIGSDIEVAGTAAVKYLDHQQISQGSKAYGQLLEGATKAWQETAKTANPNDPGVAKRFMDGLETQLTTFKDEGFYTENGQKWAEAHVEALRTHMRETTTSTMATLAGQAVQQNLQQTINSLSSTAHTDPTSLDLSLASLKSSTEGLLATSPNMTAEAAGRARTDILQKGAEAIVKSAAIGYIEKTAQMPPWATDAKYAPYINGAELKTLQRQAETQTKANALTERALKKAEREEIQSKATGAISKIWTDNVKYGPDDKAIVNPGVINKLMDIERSFPGAATNEIKNMIGVVQKEIDERSEAPKAVSAATSNELLSRIRAEDGARLATNDEIYKAKIAGKLNNTDFKFVMDEFNNSRTPEGARLSARTEDFIKAVSPQIDKSNPLMGKIDPTGKEGIYRLQVDLANKMAEFKKQGKNPFDLLDPSSPEYMGNPAKLIPYQKTLQQSLTDTATKLKAGTQPAGPQRISTKDEYEKLPTGTVYISAKDGQRYEKR